jgi:6,7-dimethyl-8-ribityllumazine synthase
MMDRSKEHRSVKKIAFIQAAWHTEVTDNCKAAFIEELALHDVNDEDIDFYSVPGSLEIPLMAKKLAQTGRYGAVCCSGLVVDGGIYRHEFVAQAVISGIVQASLETGVPVLSAVLTPQQFHENSDVHVEFFRVHMLTKGKELANACMGILKTLDEI